MTGICSTGPARIRSYTSSAPLSSSIVKDHRIWSGIVCTGIGLTAGEINPLAFTYGYERLRFPKPVLIGDTIHTELTIATLEDDPKRPGHGRIVEEVRVINQRGEVVLACDHIYLAERAKQPG